MKVTDQATVFDTNPATPVVEPTVVADPVIAAPAPAFVVPDSVQDLIGEGKKYANPEEALKSITFAQGHIEKLEDEMASLREQVAKGKALDEVLDALKDQEVDKTLSEPTPAPQVDPNTLDALIDQHLQAKEVQATVSANTKTVVDKFIEVYGDKENAIKEYTQRASDLSLSVEYLNNLAGTSPKAVFELCGLTSKEGVPTRIHSNINQEAVQPVVTEDKHKSVMGASSHKNDVDAWKAAAPS